MSTAAWRRSSTRTGGTTPRASCCSSCWVPMRRAVAASSTSVPVPAPRVPGWPTTATSWPATSCRWRSTSTGSARGDGFRGGRRAAPSVRRRVVRHRPLRHRAVSPVDPAAAGGGRRTRSGRAARRVGVPVGARRAASCGGRTTARRTPLAGSPAPTCRRCSTTAGLTVERASGAYSFLVPPAAVKSVLERGESTSDLDRNQGGLRGALGAAAKAERALLAARRPARRPDGVRPRSRPSLIGAIVRCQARASVPGTDARPAVTSGRRGTGRSRRRSSPARCSRSDR